LAREVRLDVQLETLMTRGLDEDQAVDLIIQGLLRR
jgi:Fe-S cluster assembly scaffold protein SufB